MPALTLISLPDNTPSAGPLHLGYRLFAARERRGVAASLACEALGVDMAELRKIEAGGAIPKAVVKPLRALLQQLEDDAGEISGRPPTPALSVVAAADPAPAAPQSEVEDSAADPAQSHRPAAAWPADDVRLVERLEAARAQLDITQAEMARRVGIANTTYSNMIRYAKPLGPEVRGKITAWLAEHALAAQAAAARLPDAKVPALRGAFLDALNARQMTYRMAAKAIGVDRQVFHHLIVAPDQGIALDDALRIQAWLDAPPDEAPVPETPVTAGARPIDDAPKPDVAEAMFLDPAPVDGDPPPRTDVRGKRQLRGDDGVPPPPPFDPMPAILDSIEDLRRERDREMPRHQIVHVGVAVGDSRVQALLDKFPSFEDAAGHETLWFAYYLQLAQTILSEKA